MSEEELGKGRLHKGQSAERSLRASGRRSGLRVTGGQSQAPRVKQAALDNRVLRFRQHHRALVVQVSECASALRSGSGVHKQCLEHLQSRSAQGVGLFKVCLIHIHVHSFTPGRPASL